MLNRRHFLSTSIAFAAMPRIARTETQKKKRILLRSSWQTVNIGDIAHTPGMLHLLEQHLPQYEVTLWPSSVDNGVAEMLMKRFPKLTILVKGDDAKTEAFATHCMVPGPASSPRRTCLSGRRRQASLTALAA
jgi:hypothetical protein